jgi:polysaccharide pyruvyl transferase WcaK-like protein
MNKVVIKGYYGFGNFGDDLLMVTAYHLAQKLFTGYEIIICTESKIPQYIGKLLEKPVEIVSQHTDIKVDWVIHGGGGVYFDFKEGGKKFSLLNRFIKAIGYSLFRDLYQNFQRARGRANIQTKFRAGLGIGIGTYTGSSSKFYVDILSLSDFDFLLVRDTESVNHIRRLKLSYAVHKATDLAFIDEWWNPTLQQSKKNATLTIGVVLRDWIPDNHAHLNVMMDVARLLKGEGYQLKFFAFDNATDQEFIRQFSKGFPMHVWNPETMSLNSFVAELATCDLMVSSRAHGAIVATCLGIPAICLEIEPKLAAVAAMLPTSGSLVKPDSDRAVINAIHQASDKIVELKEAARNDAAANREVMREGVAIFREFIHESSQPR